MKFPYPPKELNPNEKVHWGTASRKTKIYRENCFYLARSMTPSLALKVTIHPPDKRKRDVQNTIAACKALVDGIQDAWGIDDSQFIIDWPKSFADPVKNGAIIVEAGHV